MSRRGISRTRRSSRSPEDETSGATDAAGVADAVGAALLVAQRLSVPSPTTWPSSSSAIAALAACAHPIAAPPGEDAAAEVLRIDAAWAGSMARGDGEGWRALVAGDAIFAGRTLLRGRDEVWARPGPAGARKGAWIAVREQAGGAWKARLEGAIELPPPGPG